MPVRILMASGLSTAVMDVAREMLPTGHPRPANQAVEGEYNPASIAEVWDGSDGRARGREGQSRIRYDSRLLV